MSGRWNQTKKQPGQQAKVQLVTPQLAQWRETFLAGVATPLFFEAIFDHMPDVVFSVKDRDGRYVSISQACADRCGLQHKTDAIGRTAHDLFPAHMAKRYELQDEALFRSGRPVLDNLDLTLFKDRQPGWCLTHKTPILNAAGEVIGLACLSKDLQEPSRTGGVDGRLAQAVDLIQANYAQVLRVEEVAAVAGVSEAQLDRRMKRIFQLSTGQFIMKTRIDAAAQRLTSGAEAITDIAISCGFFDQSALTRHFRQITGLTPGQYRKLAAR